MATTVRETVSAQPFVMANGRHKGTSIEHIPVGYLKWMVNEHHTEAGRAKGELDRRGTVFPNLDISGHAINRASICCKWEYRETRKENEGLHAWLVRMAEAALERGVPRPGHEGQYAFEEMSFRFTTEHEWPVLKTVLPLGKRRREKKMPNGGQVGKALSLDPAAPSFGDVDARVHGANTGATIWFLRLQVKRDIENAVDQQKLVPYSVVLAYCEQVGEETVEYITAKIEKQATILGATRVLCALLAVVVVIVLVASR